MPQRQPLGQTRRVSGCPVPAPPGRAQIPVATIWSTMQRGIPTTKWPPHAHGQGQAGPAHPHIIVLMSAAQTTPLVGVIMGSKSDYAVMRAAVEVLREFDVPHEARVVSAHRTPELMFDYAGAAVSRGLRVLIAGAGGAAHLPGMVAARTTLPVLGVPIAATALQGFDALLSIVQMPRGIPVATLAIGGSAPMRRCLPSRSSPPPTPRSPPNSSPTAPPAATKSSPNPSKTQPHPRPLLEQFFSRPASRRHHRHLRRRPARPSHRHGRAHHGLSHPRARPRSRLPRALRRRPVRRSRLDRRPRSRPPRPRLRRRHPRDRADLPRQHERRRQLRAGPPQRERARSHSGPHRAEGLARPQRLSRRPLPRRPLARRACAPPSPNSAENVSANPPPEATTAAARAKSASRPTPPPTPSKQEIRGAWEALGRGPGVVEQAVDLEREISILVARSPSRRGRRSIPPPGTTTKIRFSPGASSPRPCPTRWPPRPASSPPPSPTAFCWKASSPSSYL